MKSPIKLHPDVVATLKFQVKSASEPKPETDEAGDAGAKSRLPENATRNKCREILKAPANPVLRSLASNRQTALREARQKETVAGVLPGSSTGSSQDIHRTLPHSVEAEQGVLGSMLISPRETIAECVEKINEAYFYVPAHQTIYTVPGRALEYVGRGLT